MGLNSLPLALKVSPLLCVWPPRDGKKEIDRIGFYSFLDFESVVGGCTFYLVQKQRRKKLPCLTGIFYF